MSVVPHTSPSNVTTYVHYASILVVRGRIPFSSAKAAACCRLRTCSFPIIRCMCVLTVFSLINKVSAISRLVAPFATKVNTLSSRGLRPKGCFPSASLSHCASRPNSSSILHTIGGDIMTSPSRTRVRVLIKSSMLISLDIYDLAPSLRAVKRSRSCSEWVRMIICVSANSS